ncbi:MAG: prepilin-type N-terminal cleavage/methylation domain-containing protein [Pirellulales bacterium]|nr:prepilin-type N-terminal cleavage/methylation domain-containing protein [Pirellulales bacterium]
MNERVSWIERAAGAVAKPQAARGSRVPRPPRGITLLEVLIAIFVVGIGMLGIAALIPVGRFALVETAKADRSAACGRAAMCEVKARGLLNAVDPNNATWPLWYWPKATPPPLSDVLPGNDCAALVIEPSPGGGILWALDPRLVGQTFVIDPLFVARARFTTGITVNDLGNGVVQDDVVSKFPFTDRRAVGANFSLPRITVDVYGRNAAGVPFFNMPAHTDDHKLLVLDRIFRWEDDLRISLDENNPERRPQQDRSWDGGLPLAGQSVGNYSWMMMVAPSATETPSVLTSLRSDHQRTYRVSIVVFFGRDFSYEPASYTPTERSLEIGFTGGGHGGGDAVLFVPWGQMPTGVTPDPEEYLAVREGQWILVYDAVLDTRLVNYPPSPVRYRRIADWYRVVSANEIEPDVDDLDNDKDTTESIRRVTLAGPDWDASKQISGLARAAVVDGVIGVYTKTIKVDRNPTRN